MNRGDPFQASGKHFTMLIPQGFYRRGRARGDCAAQPAAGPRGIVPGGSSKIIS
jgi:hypothetical protein